MRLDQAPEDVLILIIANLCFHCQNPGLFTNADMPEVVQNKRTLAYLCRTSKALCHVAQPILYHYYATGNRNKRWLYGKEASWAHDFFPQFLRTILVRRDLATHVRSLQISPPRALWHGVKLESIYADRADILDLLLKWATERKLLPWRPTKRTRPSYTANGSLHRDELLLVGLQCMTRVHTLLLSRSDCASFDFILAANENEDHVFPPPLPLITLPSLKTLGLRRASNDFKITEMGSFFRAAINLETLYACDGGGWSLDTSWYNTKLGYCSVDCKILGLFRLRKLAVDNLSTISFVDLICSLTLGVEDVVEKQYPGELLGLQDLEYYWTYWNTYNFSLDFALQMLRNTLKRLCLAYLPRSKHAYDEEWGTNWDLPESDHEYDECPYDPTDVDYDPISSLATFPLLADISLDCRSIYRPTDVDTPERLVSFLPPIVTRLRITFTFRSITRGLHQLGAQAPKDFPHLKEVVIGIPCRVQKEHLEDVESMRASGVENVVEQVGVRFAWEIDLLSADSRTIIPGATVGLNLVPCPGSDMSRIIV